MIVDHTDMTASELAALRAVVTEQPSLDRVVAWALSLEPPRLIADVVIQDEYTHDVVLPYEGGRYLVYDTT